MGKESSACRKDIAQNLYMQIGFNYIEKSGASTQCNGAPLKLLYFGFVNFEFLRNAIPHLLPPNLSRFRSSRNETYRSLRYVELLNNKHPSIPARTSAPPYFRLRTFRGSNRKLYFSFVVHTAKRLSHCYIKLGSASVKLYFLANPEL